MSEVLRTERLSVSYGGVQALSDVDLGVEEGKLVGLIGPNGAGKTTFIDAATGFTASTGRVVLCGDDIATHAPHRRARLGLARTWQSADLFDDLSVRENLLVAGATWNWRTTVGEVLTGRLRAAEHVDRALAEVGLDRLSGQAADQLTQGQRKLVGVARALAASPRIICLDEPAAGLDTLESQELGRRLRAVADRGTGLLLVDHDMGLVLSVCDEVVVLDFGKVIARGTPEQVRRDHRVVKAYLGSAADDVPRGPAPVESS
jgi:branched-chain amino acid transport system ATP-binding protein